MRPHVAAVYAFARAADDFADEGEPRGSRAPRLLDGWERRLHHAADSSEAGPPPRPGEPSNAVEIFLALGETIRSPVAAGASLRGSSQRVPAGRHRDALRDVGSTSWTIAAGPPTRRPPRASHRRVRRRAARRLVGRHLHGAAADELLAGPEGRLRPRTDLPARR